MDWKALINQRSEVVDVPVDAPSSVAAALRRRRRHPLI
jgi:hypothetical protein